MEIRTAYGYFPRKLCCLTLYMHISFRMAVSRRPEKTLLRWHSPDRAKVDELAWTLSDLVLEVPVFDLSGPYLLRVQVIFMSFVVFLEYYAYGICVRLCSFYITLRVSCRYIQTNITYKRSIYIYIYIITRQSSKFLYSCKFTCTLVR